MNKKASQLEELEKKNPFKVPEGYFENLTSQIMDQLPEKAEIGSPVISLWGRIKPWVYAAAMIVGVALVVKLFVNSPETTKSSLNLITSADIEEFYQYYEDALTNNVYHDTFYLDEEDFLGDYYQ